MQRREVAELGESENFWMKTFLSEKSPPPDLNQEPHGTGWLLVIHSTMLCRTATTAVRSSR